MDSDALRDLFSAFGSIRIRKMFGGNGVYVDDVIIAVELRGQLLLKGDAVSAPALEAVGSTRWIYPHRQSGKPVAMPYWSAPDDALDDPEEMAKWARAAYEAALRSRK